MIKTIIAIEAQRERFFGTIDAVRKRNRKVSAERIDDYITEAVKETRRHK